MRPGPTARTVPSCGFSLAVSGITRPDAVVVSASFAWTTMRSSSGLIATLVAVVTGIPSWGTGFFAYSAPRRHRRRGCRLRRAGTLVPRVLTAHYAAGWHSVKESASPASPDALPGTALQNCYG